MDKFKDLMQDLRRYHSWWWLAAIITIAMVLRFYNINYTVIFQADQGRDALIVSRIFKEGDLVAIGPITSVGNLYLGPFYYYFMMPFLWLSYPSPLGPVYAVALLGVIQVWLMYRWGRQLLSPSAAQWAAFMTAISSILVYFSRFSWNPNLVPLVTLAMVFATYKALTRSPWYWVAVAAAFSVLLQLHYITILLALGAGVCWAWQVLIRFRDRSPIDFSWSTLVKATVMSGLVVLLSFVPVVAFDLKYQGLNSSAFVKLFTKEKIITGDTQFIVTDYIGSLLRASFDRLELVSIDKVIGETGLVAPLLTVGFLLLQVGLLVRSNRQAGHAVVLVYFVTGAMGLALYKYSLFDHYLLYLIPLALLLWARLVSWLLERPLTVPVGLALVSLFTIRNLEKLSFDSSGWTIFDMERVAIATAPHIQSGEKYDVVLLSESGDISGYNYRYFLSTQHTAPLFAQTAADIDALVIVNENYREPLAKLELPLLQSFLAEQPTEDRFQIEGGPEVIVLRK